MKRILFFLLATPLFALVHEIAHFHEVEDYAQPDTAILLDIDDTLIVPSQMLGNDNWFEHRLKKHHAGSADFNLALERTLAEWLALRHITRMELVESEIPSVLASLQQKGLFLMGLTAQDISLSVRTVLQLLEHRVDLSQTPLFNGDYCFSMKGHTVLHRQGILFTSGNSKGESFFQFCEKVGCLPKRIIAVDDKLSHLHSLEKEAQKRNIEFIGLRYAYSDARKASFSPEIAEYQLTHSTFTHLLSDEEARAALQKN